MKFKKIFKCFLIIIIIFSGIVMITTYYNKIQMENIQKNNESKLEEVTLKMYLIGNKPEDFDIVYKRVNKIMKEKINATIDVEFLPWVDINERYMQLFQCGEQFDLIFTAEPWACYSKIASKNGFYELTLDMIKEYAPDIYLNEPQRAWNRAKINGKIYMVPSDQIEYSTTVFAIRGDLRKKYGIGEIKTFEDLERYMDAVANDKDINMQVISNGEEQNLQFSYMIEKYEFSYILGVPLPTIGFKVNDTSGEIFKFVDMDEYREYAYKMKEFSDKGYWSKESISGKISRDGDFINGDAAVMSWNIGSVTERVERVNKSNPKWKAEVVDATNGLNRLVNAYTNNGMAINAKSKNPERALMALNILRYDKDVYELTWYGIENLHWQPKDDNLYIKLGESPKFPADNVCPWGWYSKKLDKTSIAENNVYKKIINNWEENYTVDNPLLDFCFDDKNVKKEMDNVRKVIEKYGVPIDLGMCEDVDAAISEYRSKLNEAGLDKIYNECKKQIQEYLKNNK